jgi:sulfite reductase alpha subunit-like flavoprotein
MIHIVLCYNIVFIVFVYSEAKGMGKDVPKALVQAISIATNKSEVEAQNYFDTLQKNGRFLADIWS